MSPFVVTILLVLIYSCMIYFKVVVLAQKFLYLRDEIESIFQRVLKIGIVVTLKRSTSMNLVRKKTINDIKER